jgi:hypothetical protein
MGQYGHERRDCTSYGVGRWGDDNKGWGRTVGIGGAVPPPARRGPKRAADCRSRRP